MNISSPAGPLHTSEVPALGDYSPAELLGASSWPAIERYLQLLQRTAPDDPRRTDPRTVLRLKRHDLWLRCAVATYFGRVTAKKVCELWSQAAAELIHEAWLLAGCERAGLGLLALGKLGAEELNLSSDVDLIVVRADDVAPDLKAFREFQSMLSDTTDFGFCLRTDFTLRPGGRSAAAIPSVTEFEYHYGYHGEMWERLAYVRMRILEGPQTLRDELQTFARKFSFRKHLDYTLLDELKSLRSKIRSEKFETRTGYYHLKLGEGGIRELELFVHALQVMHGGRNPTLQTHSTTLALERIKALTLLPSDESDFLIHAYWSLRTLENRLQAYEDQQAYSVDLQNANLALPDGFAKVLAPLREKVITIATSLFGEDRSQNLLPESLDAQSAWLKERGFAQASIEETWPALLAATALSRRSEEDERARYAFLQGFVVKLAELKLDRDLGLSLLLDFVKAIRAKASFFTLLNRESRVRDELATLFSISPYLGSLLASRPELIDEFIYRKQAEPSQDFNTLLEELAERRLLSELISATQFLNDRDLRKMTINLTSNADGIAMTLLERMKAELATTDIGLVALGKWGGRELGLRSDLDFIFVTPAAPTPEDQKLAKRFLSRMTEPHRGGSIYAVDMRLRPSGNSGPIMVSKPELEVYLNEKAAAWERQAYLRSRALCDLGFHPGKIGAARGLSPADLAELKMIRGKLFKFADAKAAELDLKLFFGGLADVEFTAQIALLARGEFSLDPSTSGMIQYLEGIDAKWKSIGQSVREAYEALRGIEQLYQLTTSQSGSKMRVKSDEFKRLALLLGSSPADLETRIRTIFENVSVALREVSDLER
jgi:glutamate-ammonia-ligase adenylyltransferase